MNYDGINGDSGQRVRYLRETAAFNSDQSDIVKAYCRIMKERFDSMQDALDSYRRATKNVGMELSLSEALLFSIIGSELSTLYDAFSELFQIAGGSIQHKESN